MLVTDPWRDETRFGMRIEKVERCAKRVACQIDVGIQHQVITAGAAFDCQIVAPTVAYVTLPRDDRTNDVVRPEFIQRG